MTAHSGVTTISFDVDGTLWDDGNRKVPCFYELRLQPKEWRREPASIRMRRATA